MRPCALKLCLSPSSNHLISLFGKKTMKTEPQTARTAIHSDEPKTARTLFRSDAMQRIMAFSALIVLFIGFSIASPFFRTFDNFVGILLATAVNGVLALGVTFVIITAGIDLSVGTVMTFAAVMTAVYITNWHLPIPLGILAGLLAGGLAGFINGTVI